MALNLALLAIVLIATSPSHAQEWGTIYSGVEWDEARSVQQTIDGGYIVVGETSSFRKGYRECWVLKLNPDGHPDGDGSIAWQKTFGGTDVREDARAWCVQQTSDNGYIVAGTIFDLGTNSQDYLVLKLDGNGSIVWENRYGGDLVDVARSVVQTTDLGYIVAGSSRSFGAGDDDFWVIKLDANGNVAWQRTYGGPDRERAFCIRQTTGGGYIVVGETDPYDVASSDIWVVKLFSDGTVDWQRTYHNNKGDEAYSIEQTTEGEYIVAGITNSQYRNSPGVDIWVLKLFGDGTIKWEKSYGGDGNDIAWSVKQTTDNGYIVAGATATRCFSVGCSDFWILKLNPDGHVDGDGSIAWERSYGGNYCDYAYSIDQTTDEGYVVAGDTASFGSPKNGHDFMVLKLDANGDIAGCDAVGTSQASVADTSVMFGSMTEVLETPTAVPVDPNTFSQDTSADTREACFAPYIDDVQPSFDSGRRISGDAIIIVGGNFGDTQGSSVVHIGGKSFDSTSSKIRIWSDTLIKIRTPKYACDRFDAQGVRKRKVWITVGSVDSNIKKIKLSKPESCP